MKAVRTIAIAATLIAGSFLALPAAQAQQGGRVKLATGWYSDRLGERVGVARWGTFGTPVLLSPALARCAGAPNMLVAQMEPALLAEQLDRLSRKPAALDELRHWTSVLASGRRWPTIAARHADLYQEVLDVERHSRRSLRAG